ncbi:MAG: hypothetical protein N2043_02070 [Ignavibacterium sp.]|nr:hypothetical protein [Ignavibacterium sp.]
MNNNKRRYTEFPRHADDIGEIISANDINELQEELELQQQDLFDLRDIDFKDKVLFTLEQHPIVNVSYIDMLQDDDGIDKTSSNQIIYSENERAIAFHKDSLELVDSIKFKPIHQKKGLIIKKVMIMVDDYTPEETSIEYQISNNDIDYYTIEPNQSEVIELPTKGSAIYLKAIFKRNKYNVSPRLDAFAILYEDPSYSVYLLDDFADWGDVGEGKYYNVKPHYHSHSELLDIGPDDHHPQEHSHDGTDGSGLISHKHLLDVGPDDHHPKNHQHGKDGVDYVNLETDVSGVIGYPHLPHTLWTGRPGLLTLFRNPELEDRVIRAKSPDEDVYLVYDEEGYLSKVLTIFREVATIETMIWDEYEYTDGTTMKTLMGTDKILKDIQSEEVQDIKNLIMASSSKPSMI